MKNRKKEALANSLQLFLDESEKMWMQGVPPAQIVGFLQGTVKSVIRDLFDLDNKEV